MDRCYRSGLDFFKGPDDQLFLTFFRAGEPLIERLPQPHLQFSRRFLGKGNRCHLVEPGDRRRAMLSGRLISRVVLPVPARFNPIVCLQIRFREARATSSTSFIALPQANQIFP